MNLQFLKTAHLDRNDILLNYTHVNSLASFLCYPNFLTKSFLFYGIAIERLLYCWNISTRLHPLWIDFDPTHLKLLSSIAHLTELQTSKHIRWSLKPFCKVLTLPPGQIWGKKHNWSGFLFRLLVLLI